jgi:hypothetical protein
VFAVRSAQLPANRKCLEPPSIQDNGIKFNPRPAKAFKLRIAEGRFSAAYKVS